MKAFPGDAWSNAFIGLDGVYQTRGYTAMHGGVVMRCMQFWGALLAFHAMSRNHLEEPFVTTTCSMERFGISIVCPPLVQDSLGRLSILFLADCDVKIATAAKQFWPHVDMRTCSGHMNKNVGLSIEDKAKKKTMDGVSEKQVCACLTAVVFMSLHS